MGSLSLHYCRSLPSYCWSLLINNKTVDRLVVADAVIGDCAGADADRCMTHLDQYGISFFPLNVHLWHISASNVWSVTWRRLFEFIHFPMNFNGISKTTIKMKLNFTSILVEILHFGWLTTFVDYFFTLLFCRHHFLILTSSKLAGLTNRTFSL